ncbi:MAG: DUF1049 domain-containing protein [Aphanocapsa sp. GSE-SYN-MK-11-07L]|jgi:uncharacterized integral membrane protein|nr:DUF1049 domain-containing protein [Aphanocapsa sp. GSE-SYN-MK-11-07L]
MIGVSLLLAALLSFWVGAIAILAVQNATAVSLSFLFLRSIELPVGVVLAFAFITGLMLSVLVQPLWQLTANDNERG